MITLTKAELEQMKKFSKLVEILAKQDTIIVKPHERLFSCWRDFEAQQEDRAKNPQEYYNARTFNAKIAIKITKDMDYYIECTGMKPQYTYREIKRPIEKRHHQNKIKDYTKIGYYKHLGTAIETFDEILFNHIKERYEGEKMSQKDYETGAMIF